MIEISTSRSWLSSLARIAIRYLGIRLVGAMATFVLVISIVFLMVRLIPGDPATVLFGPGASFSAQQLQEIHRSLGLDRPFYEQYLVFIRGLLSGNLGESFRFRASVWTLLEQRIPATFILMLMSITVGTATGIVLGIISARSPNSVRDKVLRVVSLVLYSIPDFWLALLLLLGLSYYVGLFPLGDMVGIDQQPGSLDWFLSLAWHSVLPVTTLSIYYVALFSRYTRTSLLEQATEDYVLTARAKGLDERTTFRRHILRNSLLPLITLSGISLTYLFGGVVIVESIYSWPGIGLLMYDALLARDYPLLQGILIFASATVIIVSLAVDLAYAAVDPRTRQVER